MTISELQHQIEGLGDAEQRKLLGWLAQLRNERDTDFLDEMTERLDDTRPKSWLRADDA